jgi:hypothetical protein
MAVCDFCSSPEVVEKFECASFDSESKDAGITYPAVNAVDMPINVILASKGYWAACVDCAALVKAADIGKLVKRAMDEYERQAGYPHPERAAVEQHLRRTYELFFENQIRVES